VTSISTPKNSSAAKREKKMHSSKCKPESFLSPATPAIVRSKRSAGKISPPTSVRSNLFQSITDSDTTEDQFVYSSPNRTPMTHVQPQYTGDTLDAKMLLLSSDFNSFGNFVEGFNMIGIVGMGAFSEVCKVESKRKPGNWFALKRCSKIFRSEGDRERMLIEARTLKILNENNDSFSPKFYSAWQENGFLYMLVEYAEYGSVQDIIQKHGNRKLKLPDGFLWWTMHDVLQGLQSLHACEFVHLDIKPANLLIFQGWVIKLSDFGMSTKIGVSREDKEGDSRYDTWLYANVVLH
jgi:tRNA A-37 threonylcarbamoyl transferase component Bud32